MRSGFTWLCSGCKGMLGAGGLRPVLQARCDERPLRLSQAACPQRMQQLCGNGYVLSPVQGGDDVVAGSRHNSSNSDFQNIEYKGDQTGGGDTGGLLQLNLGNGSVISNGNGGVNNDWTYVNGTPAGFEAT